jgi:hypothetical protein
MDGEISELEDLSLTGSLKEEFDRAVPFHELLDVSAGRGKAELAHKGTLSQRRGPSTEALRTAILRRTASATSTVMPNTVSVYFGAPH